MMMRLSCRVAALALALATGAGPQPGQPQLHGGAPYYGIYAARDGRFITLAALACAQAAVGMDARPLRRMPLRRECIQSRLQLGVQTMSLFAAKRRLQG